MKHIIGLLAMLLPIFCGAQSPPVRALSIGDTVPDITLTNVYNYPDSVIRLSDLKGKLVILDFWATWCGSCIEAFPKMQELQEDFGEKLQVILVNTYEGDSIQRVKSFLNKFKQRTGQNIELPFSLLQSSLHEYFPFKFIPHYVWIGKDGKMIAITSQNEINKENIETTYNGDVSYLHKKEDLLDFDSDRPLFMDNDSSNSNRFIYRSILTGYIEGVGTGSGIDRGIDGRITRFYMLNNSPMSLLRNAYAGNMNFPSNRLFIESKNADLFRRTNPDNSSIYNNSYCYEIIIPPAGKEELQEYLQQDIERFFNVTVRKEVRKVKCLIIKKTAKSNNIVSKDGVPIVDINKSSHKNFLQNQPLSAFITILNGLAATRQMPLIDETKISNNIDLQLPFQFQQLNLPDLKSFLIRSGFKVSEGYRKVEVLLITDK